MEVAAVHPDAYRLAQSAIADLKTAVYFVISSAPTGLRNVDIGRSLGIYHGHVGHEGHISRTILGLMELDGAVRQDRDTMLWSLATHRPGPRVAEEAGGTSAKTEVAAQPLRLSRSKRKTKVSSDSFVNQALRTVFTGAFRKVPPYRLLFESAGEAVYFQNFRGDNAERLWYRLDEGPLSTLRSFGKPVTVCFTNPEDGYLFAIPLGQIERRIQETGWPRQNLEVSINVARGFWHELDWDVREYLIRLGE